MTGEPLMVPWQQERQQYVEQKQVFDQDQARVQQETQAFEASKQNAAIAAVGDSESQPEQTASAPDPQVRAAKVALVSQPPAAPPTPPMVPPPVEPWNPLKDRPIDTEPTVAAVWVRKLRATIASVKYSEFDPLWAGLVDDKYNRMRQAVAMVAATVQPQQIGQTPPQKLGGPTQKPMTPGSQPPGAQAA
jgi:hypothetical protein